MFNPVAPLDHFEGAYAPSEWFNKNTYNICKYPSARHERTVVQMSILIRFWLHNSDADFQYNHYKWNVNYDTKSSNNKLIRLR